MKPSCMSRISTKNNKVQYRIGDKISEYITNVLLSLSLGAAIGSFFGGMVWMIGGCVLIGGLMAYLTYNKKESI